jgi:hypothetical protein
LNCIELPVIPGVFFHDTAGVICFGYSDNQLKN